MWRISNSIAILIGVAFSSCVTVSRNPSSVGYGADFYEESAKYLAANPDFQRFAGRGPFFSRFIENYRVQLSPEESLVLDAFISDHSAHAPLAIFVHGNNSTKESHRSHADHLASWGFHTLVVQVPDYKRWLKNGHRIAELVRFVRAWPEVLGGRIDVDHIILVGHSFGGSAISVAASDGAPVCGLILLDPAIVSDRVKHHLARVDVPVMLLGADQDVFRSRKRKLFFDLIPARMHEISIKGATHDDALFPTMVQTWALGFDPFSSRDRQEDFRRAVTMSAISMGLTGRYDFAWRAFKNEVTRGRFVNARVKEPDVSAQYNRADAK